MTNAIVPGGLFRRAAGLSLAVFALTAIGATQTQNAVANGDTRTISLYHSHTKESITATFRRDGVYDRSALEKLNWFLRDWRRDEPTTMDPRLFDVIWETYRETGSSDTIRVVSAYRSPATNGMLRRRSSGVAKHSQHMLGKAMDLHISDVGMGKVREIGMRLQRGGVGYYSTAGTPFVHLDVGSVRAWPRMTRPQLERLFPDGKTVHLPADGTPLPGYQLAQAEIEQRGGSAMSYADVTSPRRSLWATLFGGGEDDEVVTTSKRGGRTVVARGTTRAPSQQTAAVAVAAMDSSSVYAVSNTGALGQETPPPVTRATPRQQRAAEKLEAEAAKATAVASIAPTPPKSEPAPKVEARKQDEDEDAKPKVAAVPLPVKRPSDLAFATLVASAVPLPPVRPADEPVQKAEAVEERGAETASAPKEAPPQVASVPLPAPRPVAFAAAPEVTVDRTALPSAITAGLAGDKPPGPTMAFAAGGIPRPAPRPPLRGETSRSDASSVELPAKQDAAPGKYALSLDTSAMQSLIAGVAAEEDKPKVTVKVAMPGVRQTHGSAIVAGRFGAPPAEAGKFSGGLVRPLEAGFVKRGD